MSRIVSEFRQGLRERQQREKRFIFTAILVVVSLVALTAGAGTAAAAIILNNRIGKLEEKAGYMDEQLVSASHSLSWLLPSRDILSFRRVQSMDNQSKSSKCCRSSTNAFTTLQSCLLSEIPDMFFSEEFRGVFERVVDANTQKLRSILNSAYMMGRLDVALLHDEALWSQFEKSLGLRANESLFMNRQFSGAAALSQVELVDIDENTITLDVCSFSSSLH